MRRRRRACKRRGFSLIEVLLAVFILGIGIISIGAIFPAGIVQQRQSLDDALGPIVADNALATLRAKLSQSDFGFAEDFDGFPLGLLDIASFEGTYGELDPRRAAHARRLGLAASGLGARGDWIVPDELSVAWRWRSDGRGGRDDR